MSNAAIFQSTLPARGATRWRFLPRLARTDFNPRSPHGERPPRPEAKEIGIIFQSTLPARGATAPRPEAKEIGIIFQSTLPARGATAFDAYKQQVETISIHAPRTGSDRLCYYISVKRKISIHAPRTGSDQCVNTFVKVFNNFNPRSPHGERPADRLSGRLMPSFQSTLPARGATGYTFTAKSYY